MDLYYRFEPNFLRPGPPTAAEGAKAIWSLAARMYYSVLLAIPELPDVVWQAFSQMISPSSLWTLALVFAGWAFATIMGGPIGLVVSALLAVYGLSQLWDEINRIADDVKAWAKACYAANSDDDLTKAGEFFASALVNGGLTVIQLLVTHKLFRTIETRLSKKYPAPRELSQKYNEAVQKRRSLKEKLKEAGRKAERAAEVFSDAARAGSGIPPKDDSALPYVVAAGVLVVGAGVAVAVWPRRER